MIINVKNKVGAADLWNEKTEGSLDVTEEEEEEERNIENEERKNRASCARTVFSLRNILTLFMSGLSMAAVFVLAGK